MKVLVLDQFSELGGAQSCLLMGLEAMRARGWKVAAGLAGSGELFGRVGELGFETFPVTCGPYSLGHKSMADGARFLAQLPRLVREIQRHVRSFGPDLVYVNGPRLLPAAALAGCQVPVLFHAHSQLASPWLRRLAGEALGRLRASVVACCRFVADSVTPFVDATRVSVIFNGVPGPRAIPLRRGSACPNIGCIGRISPEKGQLEFVAVARAIHRALPGSRFVVYGAPLFSRDAVRYHRRVIEAARGLPIEFPGWVHDIYGALAGLDILLVPSAANEATTRVILEAFAAGVPVIAFAAGGVPEVVEHGRTGFLVRSADEIVRSTIELLSSHPAHRRTISQAARKTWEARFTPECFQPRLLEAVEAAARSSE